VPVGVHGMAAAFSFNGNKIITTAGGGMLAVRDEEEAALVRKWSAQSREAATHYEHQEMGFNYRISNLLAGLGSAQLEGLEVRVAKRRATAQRYREGLRGWPMIRIQAEPPGSYATHWLSCARVSGKNEAERRARRDGLLGYLARHGIEARPLWKPMHQQPLFRGAAQVGGAVSDRLFAEGVCLPSGSGMRVEEQDEVIARIREYLGDPRRCADEIESDA
jgi:dTDP-4-amino-4,6-dideoxygalactose transaminase